MNHDSYEQNILELLASGTEISVSVIAERLYVSEPTVRRHLTLLEKKGLILRTHGGAILNNQNSPLYLRIPNAKEEKKHLAESAVKLLSNGNIIFLDGSSTALYLVPLLKKFSTLLVATNSLKTSIALTELNIENIMLGGKVNLSDFTCTDQEAISSLRKINADYFLFSCSALSEDGLLSDNSRDHCFFCTECMHYAKNSVLLIDDSKLNKTARYNICSLNEIEYCLCNIPLPNHLSPSKSN